MYFFFRFTLDAEIARKNAVLVKGPANLVSVMQSETPGARWASLHLMPTPKCRSNLSTVSVPLVSLPNTCKMMAFRGDKRGAWMAVPHQTPMVPRCRRRIFFILSASWLTLCGTQARYSKGFFRWRQHKTKARRWSLMHWLRFWRNEIAYKCKRKRTQLEISAWKSLVYFGKQRLPTFVPAWELLKVAVTDPFLRCNV